MTLIIQSGTDAPSFTLQNQDGASRSISDYKGKWLVLYFYPKDNTPGCTTEAVEFTALQKQFSGRNAQLVGISPDTLESHRKFIQKHSLKIELLSDVDKMASQAFGVWQLKKMAGREYMGVIRSTFLIDPAGIVRQQWMKVQVTGHVEDVFAQLCSISD